MIVNRLPPTPKRVCLDSLHRRRPSRCSRSQRVRLLKDATVSQAKIVPRSQFMQNNSADLPSMIYGDIPFALLLIQRHSANRSTDLSSSTNLSKKLKVPYNQERACYAVESIARSPYVRAMTTSTNGCIKRGRPSTIQRSVSSVAVSILFFSQLLV